VAQLVIPRRRRFTWGRFLSRLRKRSLRYRKYPLSRFWGRVQKRIQLKQLPDRAFAFPNRLYIDIINSCNSNCQLCPTGVGYKHELGRMSFDQFKSIIDQTKRKVWFVGLHSWGEPTLHPDIVRMVDYCTSQGVGTNVSSNIHNYNEEVYAGLFEARLSNLSMSLHGLSQETYAAYRPGMKYEVNQRNLERISRLRHDLKAYGTVLDMVFAVTRLNEHEVPLLKDFCAQYDLDSLTLYRASYNVRFLLKDMNLGDVVLGKEELTKRVRGHLDKWMAKDPQYVMPRYFQIYENPELLLSNEVVEDCRDPWNLMYITYNGDVTPCCGSYDYKKDSLGNVFREDIFDVWNNRKYQDSRRHLTKKPCGQDTLCASCPGALY
jgi:radical SAM protein with 4Fe4S-binding SPASM domain